MMNAASPNLRLGADAAALKLKEVNPLSITLSTLVVSIGAVIAALGDRAVGPTVAGLVLILLGVLILFTLKMANQWERAVVLRLGKLDKIAGPGLFRRPQISPSGSSLVVEVYPLIIIPGDQPDTTVSRSGDLYLYGQP